jgi:hypothetical protein
VPSATEDDMSLAGETTDASSVASFYFDFRFGLVWVFVLFGGFP